MDCSPPGSSVRGILQARLLEWVAISLLQGILPTQRLNPGLLHCGQIPYQLSARAALPVSYSCSLPPSRTVPTSFPLSLSLSFTHVQTHLSAAAVVGATHCNDKAAFFPPARVLETPEGCLTDRKRSESGPPLA